MDAHLDLRAAAAAGQLGWSHGFQVPGSGRPSAGADRISAAKTPKVWQAPRGADPCLGIDHSAIVVSNSAASVAFYQRLGFTLAAHSLNHGTEQEKLDAISGVEVDVTRLHHAGMDAPPQLELLCYRSPPARATSIVDRSSNDIATTRLLLDAGPGIKLAPILASLDMRLVSDGAVAVGNGRQAVLLRDPDAHHLMLVG